VRFDCKMGLENLVEIAPAVRFAVGVKEANHLFPTIPLRVLGGTSVPKVVRRLQRK